MIYIGATVGQLIGSGERWGQINRVQIEGAGGLPGGQALGLIHQQRRHIGPIIQGGLQGAGGSVGGDRPVKVVAYDKLQATRADF